MKALNNVVQLSQYKQKFNSDDIYNKCHDRWIDIKRACDPTKTIVAEAVLYIAAIEFLFLKNPSEVIFDGDQLVKKFAKGSRQRSRYLKQLGELYNIQYHSKYSFNGKIYRCVFSCTRTKNSIEILNDPKGFYSRQTLDKYDLDTGQKSQVYLTNLSGTYKDIDDIREEREDIPQGYISSLSQGRDARARQDHSSDLLAANGAASPTECSDQSVEASKQEAACVEITPKASKPRIVITAAMQQEQPQPDTSTFTEPKQESGLARKALVGSISPSKEEVPSTGTSQASSQVLTAKAELEHYSSHRIRIDATEEQNLGATVFSLLSKLEVVPQEFNQTDPIIEAQELVTTEESEPKAKTINEIMEEKMASMPEYGRVMQEAIDAAAIAYEYEIDRRELKSVLLGLTPELDASAKLVTFYGNWLNIGDLKKKHLKLFGEAFRKMLPEYEFKLKEQK